MVSQNSDINSEIMTMGEIAAYLKVSEKTISRMLSDKEIPATKVSNQWRFVKTIIDDWLMMKIQNVGGDDLTNAISNDEQLIPLSRLILSDQIIMDLKGGTKKEILRQLVAPLLKNGKFNNYANVVEKLLQRETMVSTAVGHGIAIPHVRDPKELGSIRPTIVLGISKDGVAYDSIDGEPTYVFALCISSSEVVHLRLMAKISFLFKKHGVVDKLRKAKNSKDVMAELLKADEN